MKRKMALKTGNAHFERERGKNPPAVKSTVRQFCKGGENLVIRTCGEHTCVAFKSLLPIPSCLVGLILSETD